MNATRKLLVIASSTLVVAALLTGCGNNTGTVAPVTPPAAKPQVKAGGKVSNGGVFDATPDAAPPGVQTGTK